MHYLAQWALIYLFVYLSHLFTSIVSIYPWVRTIGNGKNWMTLGKRGWVFEPILLSPWRIWIEKRRHFVREGASEGRPFSGQEDGTRRSSPQSAPISQWHSVTKALPIKVLSWMWQHSSSSSPVMWLWQGISSAGQIIQLPTTASFQALLGFMCQICWFFFFLNVLSYSLCPFLQTKSPHSDKGQADSQSCSSSHHWPSFCLGDKLSGMLTATFSCLGKMSRDKTRSLIMEGSVNWTQLFEADL